MKSFQHCPVYYNFALIYDGALTFCRFSKYDTEDNERKNNGYVNTDGRSVNCE